MVIGGCGIGDSIRYSFSSLKTLRRLTADDDYMINLARRGSIVDSSFMYATTLTRFFSPSSLKFERTSCPSPFSSDNVCRGRKDMQDCFRPPLSLPPLQQENNDMIYILLFFSCPFPCRQPALDLLARIIPFCNLFTLPVSLSLLLRSLLLHLLQRRRLRCLRLLLLLLLCLLLLGALLLPVEVVGLDDLGNHRKLGEGYLWGNKYFSICNVGCLYAKQCCQMVSFGTKLV